MSKVNLALPSVQIREIRINSITGFSGTAEELVAASACGLKDRNRSFSQCLGCSITKAACMTILIQDGAVITHGPIGCSSCLTEYAFTYKVNGRDRGVEHPTLYLMMFIENTKWLMNCMMY